MGIIYDIQSAGMNYYEELGVTPTAETEEIRRAHRRLTKIYHPDGHAEQHAKQRAEEQLRRVNAIVAILCNPQQRLKYNDQLKQGTAPTDPMAARLIPPPASRFYLWRWWIISLATACLLTAAVLWFWMSDWGGLFKNRHPTTYIAPETTEKPARTDAPPPVASTTVTVVPSPPPEEKGKAPTAPPAQKNQ